jgi:hypothetical protein
MLYQALARMPDQGATFPFHLLQRRGAIVYKKRAIAHRASQLALIFVVIKHQCRMTMFQFYA